jgi:hypothetical protein
MLLNFFLFPGGDRVHTIQPDRQICVKPCPFPSISLYVGTCRLSSMAKTCWFITWLKLFRVLDPQIA